MIYHVHIFSKFMPIFKGFYSTNEDAFSFVEKYIQKYFPTEYVFSHYKAKYFDERESTHDNEMRINKKINDSIANSYNIIAINEDLCPNYKNIFLSKQFQLSPFIFSRLKRFYNTEHYHGSFKPTFC